MKQKPFSQRFGDFMEGKGFYIVLFLCVAAIGISGYFLFSGLNESESPTLDLDPSLQQVVGQDNTVQVPEQTPNVITPPVAADNPAEDALEETETEDSEANETEDNSETSLPTAFTWPVRGTISRDYSLEVFAYDETMGDWRTHSGLDIDAALGTEVLAVAKGSVTAVYEDALLGSTVIIDHGDGLQSLYANLTSSPTVAVGDAVNPGTIIGAIGSTAKSESAKPSHLHFEMLQSGVSIDPVQFLPEGY